VSVDSPPPAKEAWRVAAGREGARRRWGDVPRRVPPLSELHPADREAILAILAARANAAPAPGKE
jgi:hypothetical protein